MKVYVVERMFDIEDGNTQVVKIFGTKEQARAYVKENQKYISVWWEDEDVPELEYYTWEVE